MVLPPLSGSTLPNSLVNSPDLFLSALERIPEPIVLSQPEGTVTYVNTSARQVLKLELGRSVTTRLLPEDSAKVIESMRGGEYDGDLKFYLAETHSIPVAVAVRVIAEEVWLWRFQDLTRQSQMAAEWAAENTLLERSSRYKSEFLANMSHELRTPLTSILGFSSILKQQIFGALNPKQETYMHQIHRSGQHLLALINDMLDLSKIEAGQMSLEKIQLTVRLICQESIDLVQAQASAREIVIKLTIVAPVQFLYADELRVRQMLLNLLSNAIKFSPPSGEINVMVTQGSGIVNIAVRDEGDGIPLNKQGLIFRPFQQVDPVRDRRQQGTGLGLALTQHLAELHQGTVTFESEPGVGSCFVLRLPECGQGAVWDSNRRGRDRREGDRRESDRRQGRRKGDEERREN